MSVLTSAAHPDTQKQVLVPDERKFVDPDSKLALLGHDEVQFSSKEVNLG